MLVIVVTVLNSLAFAQPCIQWFNVDYTQPPFNEGYIAAKGFKNVCNKQVRAEVQLLKNGYLLPNAFVVKWFDPGEFMHIVLPIDNIAETATYTPVILENINY